MSKDQRLTRAASTPAPSTPAPEELGVKVVCPGCGRIILLPSEELGAVIECAACDRRFVAVEDFGPKRRGEGWRARLSLPWLVLLFVFGFLPWSEVSCVQRDFPIHVSQSGYQGLWGGVSSPFDLVSAAKKALEPQLLADKKALARFIEHERSDFLQSFSPFLTVFWAGALALVLCVAGTPLGQARLRVVVAAGVVMLGALLLTLGFGTPLERRLSCGMEEAFRERPQEALVVAVVLTSGKTCWFWLAGGAVVLVLLTEYASWSLWRGIEKFLPAVTVGLGGCVLLAACGVAAQGLLWRAGINSLEGRLGQIQQAEDNVARQAERARREQEESQLAAERAAQAKRDADVRRLREENEARKKALEQERERLRLDQEKARLEAEREAKAKRDKEEQEAAERARKKADEEARARREREKREEAQRREEERAQGLVDKAEKLYADNKLVEALAVLDGVPSAGVAAAAGAKALRERIEGEIKKNEPAASNAWLYARRLYLDGHTERAIEKLKEVQKKYPGTRGAKQAKELQDMIDK